MKSNKELKQSVMKRFTHCWGENTAIFFITVAGIMAVAFTWGAVVDFIKAGKGIETSYRRTDLTDGTILAVTVAAVVVLWLLMVPFTYGVKWYRLQQIRGNSVHARSIFSCYGSWKRIGQALRMSLAIYARRLSFTAPLAAFLAAGIFIISVIERESSALVYSASVVMILLLAGGIVCAAFSLNYKYAAAPYLFVLNPDAPPAEIISRSKELSAGKSDYITEAMLSVAGWLAACIFIYPAIFAVPYMEMVYTAAVNEMIRAGDKDGGDGKKEELFAGEYMHN